ncbi:MAG: exodeoxyribonuclease VII small subunit [Clostridia bacterium]|nr:exodeoxyribonuclease VII small subunit [Clostridia bacterium]MBR2327990.1 exodeoxyribonuclease VII small subunit [Clostridia bacterium]
MNFEDKMKRLEEIVLKLESGSVSVSDAIALYEEGSSLSAELTKLLSDAEQKIELITEKEEIK